MKQLTLSTRINTETTITESTIYTENEGGDEAEINFCLRLSLMSQPSTMTDDPNITTTTTTTTTSEEINHVETAVRLCVDLKDEFKILGQSVEAMDEGRETAEDSFFVEAFVCNDDGIRILDSVSYLQGEMVRVCIRPTLQALELGFRMASIDRFTFQQGYVSQEAIIAKNKPAMNGLTDVSCTKGYEICTFETLLKAEFFYNPTHTVDGTGFATLQFGSKGGGGGGTVRQLLLRVDNTTDDYTSFSRKLQAKARTIELEPFQIARVGRKRRRSAAEFELRVGLWIFSSLAIFITNLAM